MDRKEAIERIQEVMTIIRTQHMCKDMDGECTTEDRETYIQRFEALRMAIEALQEPERSYDEIMVGDIIKNFGCEYEVHSMSHIKDELFISAYRIRGEEE